MTARKNMDHSLKVELSYEGTWFSFDTNGVVKAQSSSKCPLKQLHNTHCLTLNVVNSSDWNVTGIASLH